MRKIWEIEKLRAVAAAMVIISHFSISSFSLFGKLHMPFYLGADLFFVISGYFIGASIAKPDFQIVRYLKKRFMKLYPPLFLLIFLSGFLNLVCAQLEGCDVNLYCSMDVYVRESVENVLAVLSAGGGCYTYGALWYLRSLVWIYIVSAAVGAGFNFLRGGVKKNVVLWIYAGVLAVCLVLRVTIFFGNDNVGRIFGTILNWKMDFCLAGVVCAVLPESVTQWLGNRQNVKTYMYLCLAIPFVINLFTETPLSNFYDAKYLTSIGYGSGILCYSIAVVIAVSCRENQADGMHKVLQWTASRSYYLYLFDFFALVITWLIIYYAFPKVFLSVFSYWIAQAVIGSIVLAVITECLYRQKKE